MLCRSLWIPALALSCGGTPTNDTVSNQGSGGAEPAAGGQVNVSAGGAAPSGGTTGGELGPGGTLTTSGGTSSGGTSDGDGGEDSSGSGGASPGSGGAGPDAVPPRLLLFTHTAGFRHDSIADGVELFSSMALQEGWSLDHAEDSTVFNALGLADVSCVIFLSTTGDILDESQQVAFENWFKNGRAFVGIHAATDTEYDWGFYTELVGAKFKSHPAVQMSTVLVDDRAHPATAHLNATWSRTDEWYDFLQNPSESVRVLLRLDETTYEGGTMGSDHPIAWSQEITGGRSFYTGLGHTSESFGESDYIEHLRGGLRWALGLAD